jgi:hypothetical protein
MQIMPLSQAELRSSNRASQLAQAVSIPAEYCSWPRAPPQTPTPTSLSLPFPLSSLIPSAPSSPPSSRRPVPCPSRAALLQASRLWPLPGSSASAGVWRGRAHPPERAGARRQAEQRLPNTPLIDACLFSPKVACFHVFAHRLAVFRRFCCNTGQRTCPRQVKRPLLCLRQTSTVSTFSPFVQPFLGVSVVTWGNIRVCVKLSDTCLFSPDVACFHIFAFRLAVFRHFRCHTWQHLCPRQIKRCLPIFARRRPFPCFRPSFGYF